jgi:hypothetical protein
VNRAHSSFNPFYALVVFTGLAFLITALAYVAALVVSESPVDPAAGPARASPVLLFVEQRGESLMLWEAGALAVAAVLAMGLDRWRTAKSRARPAIDESQSPRDPTATRD